MKLKDVDSKVEISGQTLYAILTHLTAIELQDTLTDLGLNEIDPTAWYPIGVWRKLFEKISDEPNVSTHLIAIGLEIGLNATLPNDLSTLLGVLSGFDRVYQYHHRNGDIGHVKVKQIIPQWIKVYHPATYPSDFLYGLFYGITRRFCPRDQVFTVAFDPNEPTIEEGNDYVVLDIRWQ